MGGSSTRRPVNLPVRLAQPGADDVVEQRAQRLDHQVEGAGDQDGAVAEGPVPADPGDAGRERLGQQQAVEELPPVVPQPVDGRPFVATVEGPQEVAPVPPVEQEQRRGLAHEVGHERHPLGRRQVPRRQPGVGVDHVGGDERVLEVEGGQMAVGGEDGLAGPVGAVGLGRPARRRADPGVLDDRGEVDVADVGGPSRRRPDRGRTPDGRPRPSGPTGPGGGPPGSGPRSRCRRRTARRSRGPGRPAGAAPRGRPSRPPAGPGWAGTRPPARPGPWPGDARDSWRCTRPRPGNDHSGTTMGWPSLS